MTKRILVIVGHPAISSLCQALAEAYSNGASEVGHIVDVLNIRDLDFDPILHEGYSLIQELEPSLQNAQRRMSEANHLVCVYPTWWGGIPALFKGFIDRTILPGYAFKYRPSSPWWDKYWTGKTAHIITTMDTPPWYYRIIYRDAGVNQLRRTILEYCGAKPVRVTRIGRVKGTSKQWKIDWIEKVRNMGRNA